MDTPYFPPRDFGEHLSVHTGQVTERDLASMNTRPRTNETNSALPPRPAVFSPKYSQQPLVALATLTIVSFLAAYNTTNVSAALPKILLPGSSVQGFWIVIAYALTNAVFQPFLASLSAILGRGRVLFMSVLLMTIGSIMAGAGQNLAAVTAGRVFQGMGSAGCSSLALVLPAKSFPLSWQQVYIGIVEAAQAIGFIFGGLIGAGFASVTTWRWIFYFNLPFCGIALIAVPFAFGLEGAGVSFRHSLHKVDVVGIFLFGIGLMLFTMGIVWGGIMYQWKSIATILTMILGLVAVVASAIWESVGAVEPFMRHRLFYRRTANIAYFATFVQGFVLYSQIYFISIYLESVKAINSIGTAASLFALVIPIIPAFAAANTLINKVPGSYVKVVWVGLTLQTFSSGLMMIFDLHTPTAGWAIILVFAGIGQGLTINGLDYAIQSVANDADVIYAACMSLFFRSLGISLGICTSASMFLNLMKADLHHIKELGALAEHALELIEDLHLIPNDWATKTVILKSYVRGVRATFALCLALSAVALIMSMLMRARPLTRTSTSTASITTTSAPAQQRNSRLLSPGPLLAGPEYRASRNVVYINAPRNTTFGSFFEMPPLPKRKQSQQHQQQQQQQQQREHQGSDRPVSAIVGGDGNRNSVVSPLESQFIDIPINDGDDDEAVKAAAAATAAAVSGKQPRMVRNTSWFLTPHAIQWTGEEEMSPPPPIPPRGGPRGPISP